MKNIVTVIIALLSVITVRGQEDFVPKFDGTKYYMLIYDGDKNQKVLTYKTGKGWNEAIGYTDYFDGSNGQLWVFEEPDEHPGYINVRNLHESLSDKHFLKSWSWYAYMEEQSGAREGDQERDLELVYRFQHIFDGWQALETIEKPKGLYGVDYTPGADALNIDANGVASFSGVKTSDITPENAVHKVFKLVEFDPMALFIDAIERGQQLLDDYPQLPEVVKNEFFYVLEKARETRVFGTEAEMLAFQPEIDEATVKFTGFTNLDDAVMNALGFIEASEADSETRASFQNVISRIQDFMNGAEIDYTKIDGLQADLEAAQNLVNAIIAAETVRDTLNNQEDTRLASGLTVAIEDAKAVLASAESTSELFSASVSILSKMEEFLNETISANELIIQTEGFEEAKQILTGNIDEALTTANTSGISLEELTAAVKKLQADVKAFKKALEAGDTVIALENPGFEEEFYRWNTTSDTDWLPYTENKGVDGSKNMTIWNSANYTFVASQSIEGIPNGTYQLSVMSTVSNDSTIALFAESGGNASVLPLAFEEWSLTERMLEIEVTDGTLIFGIRGNGEGNEIPANHWGTFDNFELKWLSNVGLVNPGFENEFEGWTNTTDTGFLPYTENKGVDGSKNMTIWNSANYTFRSSQTVTGLQDGKYQLSVMSTVSNDSTISFYASSGGETVELPLAFEEWTLTKRRIQIEVTGGSMEFGIKGSGENDMIPANHWGTFDNFEVLRLPDVPFVNPGFEEDFAGWTNVSDSDGIPYIENKGVNGSKSVTFWNGADYRISTSQLISGLVNGSYEVSVWTMPSVDNSFTLFGKSGSQADEEVIMFNGWELTKDNVLARVSDGTLEIGVRGSGEDNLVPANHWIVFDDFEVKIKSIIPEYNEVSMFAKQVTTGSDLVEKEKNAIVFWQKNKTLNVRSDEIMEDLAVYSITGAIVSRMNVNGTFITVPLNSGIYIARVFTRDGEVETKKVVIH
jgi:hypothetical protein